MSSSVFVSVRIQMLHCEWCDFGDVSVIEDLLHLKVCSCEKSDTCEWV